MQEIEKKINMKHICILFHRNKAVTGSIKP